MSAEETQPAPAEKGKKHDGPVLRPHVYDGIQEFDQRLPNWWLFTLYIMIAFTFVAWLWNFQVAKPMNYYVDDYQRVEGEVAIVKEIQRKNIEKVVANLSDAKLWAMSQDKDVLARGQVTYEGVCFTCHAKDMTGIANGTKLPGQPLHDAEWKYGGKPMQIYQVVAKGSPDVKSGMIAWEPQFGAAKVAEAVAYILSKHKQSPENVATGPK
jgi:cytochrome c oxidase cbb3-type subunit 3